MKQTIKLSLTPFGLFKNHFAYKKYNSGGGVNIKGKQYWAEQMAIRNAEVFAANESLRFLEEKLGKVNTVVIEFRKFIKKYDKGFDIAQENYRNIK